MGIRIARGTTLAALVVVIAFVTGCGSSDDSPAPMGSGGTPFVASGGSSGGGVPGASGGVPGAAGAANVPAGQLVCGGKTCHAGGHCAPDGACPAFLADCFAKADGFGTCGGYCESKGFACARESCNASGAQSSGGYSVVTYPPTARATCEAFGTPNRYAFDSCETPIELDSPSSTDGIARCCCRDK